MVLPLIAFNRIVIIISPVKASLLPLPSQDEERYALIPLPLTGQAKFLRIGYTIRNIKYLKTVLATTTGPTDRACILGEMSSVLAELDSFLKDHLPDLRGYLP